jgi:hypothetical protein
MERDIEWQDMKSKQKKILFNNYITDKIKENEKRMENDEIEKLIYNKNIFLFKNIKNETYYKNLKNEDIEIKNNEIYKIRTLEANKDGLFCIINNKLKQTKLTDYKTNRKNIKYTDKSI